MRGAAQLKAEYETKARGCRYSIQGARRDSLRRLTASNIISGPGSVTLARHAAVAVLPGLGTVTIIKMEIFITVSSAIKTMAKMMVPHSTQQSLYKAMKLERNII